MRNQQLKDRELIEGFWKASNEGWSVTCATGKIGLNRVGFNSLKKRNPEFEEELRKKKVIGLRKPQYSLYDKSTPPTYEIRPVDRDKPLGLKDLPTCSPIYRRKLFSKSK